MAAETAKQEALDQAALEAAEAQRVAVAAAVAEAGVGTTLDAYNTANIALHVARGASSQAMWSVDNAQAFKDAADAAWVAANIAKAAADQNGNTGQMAMAQSAVDNAKQAVLDATDAVTYATNTARTTADAIAHAMAIVPVRTDADMVAPFDSATADDNVTIAATRKGDVRTVTLTVPDGATDFEAAGTPSAIRSWDGSMHSRSDDDATSSEDVVVYTNIARPGDQAYETYYGTSDQTGVTGSVNAGTGVLELSTTPANVAAAAEAGLYSSANFPTAGDQIRTYPEDDPETDDIDESDSRMFAGSFNDVPGMYTCTGACEATATATGLLRTLTGTWNFTPEAYEADKYEVVGVVPDADYLYFGYWLKTDEGDDGNDYTFQAFSGGELEFAVGQISEVEGSASYRGPAAGVYVQKANFNDAGMHGTATTGRFRAMANLSATFDGGATVAAADWFSIKGTVDDFEDGITGRILAGRQSWKKPTSVRAPTMAR